MNTVDAAQANTKLFQQKLPAYKQAIDADIAAYCKQIEHSTLQNYGANSRVATDAFISILQRGGKRIRGALVLAGYEMSGGTDHTMIMEAARAIEMTHAYILIIDDIQDRSVTRRGGPTAHIALADYHRQHQLADGPEHFGIAIALNAALSGNHSAQMLMANLKADPQLVLKAVSILNRTMLVTAHGQTNDIMNEVVANVDQADVERAIEWKTAHYTFLNPLHVGMVLAGADCSATDAITDYAMHAGKAFQITDDILGTFGSEFDSGKSPLDDMREGKRTVLSVYGLAHAQAADKNFLIQMLGNHNLTQVEFMRCKDILAETGALDYARGEARRHVKAALASLEHEQTRWSPEGVQFLQGLAAFLLERQV